MKTSVKFLLFFIPVAIIATFVYHALINTMVGNMPQTPPGMGAGMSFESFATWSVSIMTGCAIGLLAGLIGIKKYIPIVIVLIYFFTQSAASIPIALAVRFKPEWTTTAMALCLIIASIAMILLVHGMRFYNVKLTFKPSLSLPLTLAAVGAAILAAFGGNILNESLDLQNIMEEQFNDLSLNIAGMLAIAIIGPIAEEVVFRGAVCNSLLKKGVPTGLTIFISATIFGLVHFNPAQIPFAFLLGLVFGYLYCRTGSLVPSIIAHILNNTVSVILLAIYQEEAKEITFKELFGSQAVAWTLMAVAFIACGAILYMLHKKCKPAEQLWSEVEEEDNTINTTPPPIPQDLT